MKKMLAVLIITVALIGTVFANGNKETSSASKSATITLMQNKPEIDGMLKNYAKVWNKETGNTVIVKSIGGTSSVTLSQQLKADYSAGSMPDIFVIQGIQDYKEWAGTILDLSGEKWVKDTTVAFKNGGKVYGFPVSIEGWGLAYNADMLAKAGIDPATLDNYEAYKAAFAKLDSMKAELGINSVVSMAAGPQMGWVTADHNFNSLLANGLPYGDMSVVNQLLKGQVDQKRLSEYADWVGLLFKYSDKAILTTGDYAAQVGAFATQKAVFLHQGNWVDPNMKSAKATFKMAFAPHGSEHATTDGIFVAAPSYYVINSKSKHIAAAKKFLNDMVFTSAGQDFMVTKADMIPAFTNIKLNPSGQLSRSVQKWAAEGKIYSWDQYSFTSKFRSLTLAPIYNQFANGSIDKAKFIVLMTKAFESLKK